MWRYEEAKKIIKLENYSGNENKKLCEWDQQWNGGNRKQLVNKKIKILDIVQPEQYKEQSLVK